MTTQGQVRQELPSWGQAIIEQYYAPCGQKEEILRQVQELREKGFPYEVLADGLSGMASRAVRNSKRSGEPVEDHIRRAVAERRLRNHVDGIMNRIQTSRDMEQWASDPSEDWFISDG